MTVALVSMAQVLALATTLNARAGRMTYAAVLASAKEEELRGLDWDPLRRTAGQSVDYLDRAGAPTTSAGAAYVRESTVQLMSSGSPDLIVIRVVVHARDDTVSLESIRTRRLP